MIFLKKPYNDLKNGLSVNSKLRRNLVSLASIMVDNNHKIMSNPFVA